MIECGIPLEKIKRAVWNYNIWLTGLDACLVSHSHGDHCKAAKDLAKLGVNIYASEETITALGIEKENRVRAIDTCKGLCFMSADICAFNVEHDAKGTLGFVIQDRITHDRLLYVTDTPYLPVNVDGITHLMIEANYDPDIMQENVDNGMNLKRAVRTVKNHMSIETTLQTLEKMDKSKLKEVWLLHLSRDNAGDDFKKRAQEICGCEVYVA